MGTAILRPNSTPVASAGWVIVGGSATHHAAQSDNSDATKSTNTAATADASNGVGSLQFDFDTFAFPALSQIRSVQFRLRGSATATGAPMPNFTVHSSDGNVLGDSEVMPLTGSITTHAGMARVIGPTGAAWSQATIDALIVYILGLAQGATTNPVWNLFEVYAYVVYNEAPAVVVTGPAEGSVVVTSRPTIVWNYTDPDGNNQERYQVKIFNPAQYSAAGFNPETSTPVWASGELFSNASSSITRKEHLLTTDLPNNSLYRAYVKAADVGSGARYSAWDYNQFTVTVDQPATPVVTAVVDNTLSRIAVTIQGNANLLSYNQSSLETDATGWENGINATVARSTQFASHGVGSLSMTAIGAGTMAATTPTGILGFPIAPSKLYTALASFRAFTTARTVRAEITFYTSAGAVISTVVGDGVANTSGTWTQVTVSATSPSNAAFAAVIVNVAATAAGEVHFVDRISFAPGSSTTWTRGGYAASQTFSLERSDNGGTTWTFVRGGATLVPDSPANQQSIVYDYEAPSGVAVLYRARSTGLDGVNVVSSPDSATATGTQLVTRFWLKCPETPALNMMIRNTSPVLVSRKVEQQGRFVPLGRNRPIVVRGALTGTDLELLLVFFGEAEYAKFEAIRAAQKTLLLQDDMNHQWYVSVNEEVETSLSFGPERKGNPHRKVTLSLTEVEAP